MGIALAKYALYLTLHGAVPICFALRIRMYVSSNALHDDYQGY